MFAVSAISTPDAADKQALAQPRDGKVVVYEDLPVDRSLAFFRTPVPAAPGEGGDQAAPAATGGAICTSAPMAMMLLMALVTLINGVCNAGVTFHTTM